jgi:ABC-type Na+ efflux pump permease subunit
LRAAASISQERENGTLDSLLTLPYSRNEILRAKWLAAILSGRGFGYLVLLAMILGSASGVLHPFGIGILILAIAAQIAFVASTGVWLSTASRTAQRARIAMAVVLMTLLGGGLSQMMLHSPTDHLSRRSSDVPGGALRDYVSEAGVNLPGSWEFLAFTPKQYEYGSSGEDSKFMPRLFVAFCGAIAYALAAAGMCFLACRRFRKDPVIL